MFTGIVQAACVLESVTELPGLRRFVVALPAALLPGLQTGASVSVDGVCLTVTAIDNQRVHFDVIQQTLDVSNLGDRSTGDRVNIERSLRQGDEIGGHIVSGHVDTTVCIDAIDEMENNRYVHYRVPPAKMPYLFDKGFVALNGCSLTVAAVDREANRITVCFIPETLRLTTHGDSRVGDRINLEIDRQVQVIVDTVESYLSRRQ